METGKAKRRIVPGWLLVLLVAAMSCMAQDAPVISGGAGFIGTRISGVDFFQPVIAPVGVLPLGKHVLIEARGDLRGVVARQFGTSGDWRGQFFGTLEYLQIDVTLNRYLTVSGGRFLTPFGIYNERFTPIWIRNFQDAPLIYPIGTRTTGSSDGAMLRGAVPLGSGAVEWNYVAYASAGSTVDQLVAARTAGFRTGIYVPRARFEVGASYQRFREGVHFDSSGVYLAWQPARAPLDLRSEYAHAPSGHGYWIEAAYRVDPSRSWPHRFQPAFRWQQFWRLQPSFQDLLGAGDMQQADFALNYYLRPDLRISSSYGRQFGNVPSSNRWNIALTYRFLLPLAKGAAQ